MQEQKSTKRDSRLKQSKEEFKLYFEKRIKDFILCMIRFIDFLPKDNSCRIIGSQLLRSGTSVGANYFEARAASSKKDFINFFSYSLKSANETKFWLEILIGAGKCDKRRAKALLDEAEELANILDSSLITMKNNSNSIR